MTSQEKLGLEPFQLYAPVPPQNVYPLLTPPKKVAKASIAGPAVGEIPEEEGYGQGWETK